MKSGLVHIAALIFISTLPAIGTTQRPRQGGQVVVPYGRLRVERSSGVSVRFLKVVEDSRCPKGVNCVWAGAVTIKIQVAKAGKTSKILELSTLKDRETANFEGKRITLIRVTPYPEAGKKIEPGSYVLTLKISDDGS